MARVLVACEESHVVTIAFRELGIEAYSCDIGRTSGGGHPGWHLRQDVLPLLKEYWNMIIAFPPCTHLSVSGARWFKEKRADGRQQAGIDFFMKFTETDCPRVAIENPVGIMSTVWRKPDQIVQPWIFGEVFSKRTCLWLKGLPVLHATKIVGKGEYVFFESGKKMPKWYADAYSLKDRAKIRSRTFAGICSAMAAQWGGLL